MSPELIAMVSYIAGAASIGAMYALRRPTPQEERPRIEVRDDLRNLPPGSIVTVSYDGILNTVQRQALKSSIEYQVGQGVKVIVLEAGIRIDVQAESQRMEAGYFYDPYNPGEPAREAIIARLNEGKMDNVEVAEALADGKISINDVREAKARRRDDNRSHHEPSEPWN